MLAFPLFLLPTHPLLKIAPCCHSSIDIPPAAAHAMRTWQWLQRQSLLSTLVSTLISSSLLFLDALLLAHADLAPPTGCVASKNTTTCFFSKVHISFPFLTDQCPEGQSDFVISGCEQSSLPPRWLGFTRNAISDTHLNSSMVMMMRSPLDPTNISQECQPRKPLTLNPCHGYINLTWNQRLLDQSNNNICDMVDLKQISDYIPSSINLHDFAHSAFDFDSTNVILLLGCNDTLVDASILDADTVACNSYIQHCKSVTDEPSSKCYQYKLPILSKKLALPQVMESSHCRQATFFVTLDPSLPVSAWQPGWVQLHWDPLGRGWLQSTLQLCRGCVYTNGSCGYGSSDAFQCYCGNKSTSTNCSESSPASPTVSISPASPTVSPDNPSRVDSVLNHDTGHNHKNLKIFLGVAGSLATGLFMSLAIFSLFYFCKKRKASTKASLLCSPQHAWIKRPSFLSRKQDPFFAQEISYEELVCATDAFAEENILGDGGFGAVYKGVLANGLKVAVKRLHHNNYRGIDHHDNYRRIDHFYNEIKVLSNLSHPNLVKLFAFCVCKEEEELLLVFEYASQGTVSDHLHSGLKSQLSWSCRLNIACETAAALSYLHNAVNPPIYHRDVKTTNILLDDNFHAKLADFGLSKLVPMKETHVSTAPQGTPGYLDPEYHQCYQLTEKSDVYSLGVVLMELISAKLAVDMSRERGEINLSTLAVVKIQCGLAEELVDPKLEMKKNPSVEKSIKRVIELAFACLQVSSDDRPTMEAVAEELAHIRREHEEARVNTHKDPQDASSTPPAQKPQRSPTCVYFSSDSSCPSSTLSSS